MVQNIVTIVRELGSRSSRYYNIIEFIICTCRFSDFIVNEVDINGEVVHLTDISEPACDQQVGSIDNVVSYKQTIWVVAMTFNAFYGFLYEFSVSICIFLIFC